MKLFNIALLVSFILTGCSTNQTMQNPNNLYVRKYSDQTFHGMNHNIIVAWRDTTTTPLYVIVDEISDAKTKEAIYIGTRQWVIKYQNALFESGTIVSESTNDSPQRNSSLKEFHQKCLPEEYLDNFIIYNNHARAQK